MPDQVNQYDVCQEHFRSIGTKLDETASTLDDIYNRLFVDNGRTSMQSRVGRLEGNWKILCFITAPLYLLLLREIITWATNVLG